MKTIRNLFPLFVIVCTVIFFACEKDQSIMVENETSFKALDVVGHVVKGDSIRQINKDLNLFLRDRFEERNRFSSEDITSNVYGFMITTDRILQLNGDTYTNYIFNVTRDNPISDGFENYMLTVFNDGRYMQVLIYYPLIDSEDGAVADINGATVTYIDDDSLLTGVESSPCANTSEEIIGWSDEADCFPINCGLSGNHSPGEKCNDGVYRSYWICLGGWVVTGCLSSGGSSSGSGSTNPTDPFPPTGNGGNPTNPIDPNSPDEQVPTVPFEPEWQEIVDCMNGGILGSLNNSGLLSPEDIDWLQDRATGGQYASAINNFINENGCEESDEFVKEAIEALRNDGEVDFEEKIILDPSFTGKAKCIYNKMKSGSVLSKALAKFSPSNTKANVTFKLGDLGGNTRAKTTWPDAKGTIVITLNNNSTSLKRVDFNPNIFVANTIIHEVIHAEFLRQILNEIGLGKLPSLTPEEAIASLENGDRHVIYEYFRSTKDWSHNFMADYYRDTFARATQEFDTGTAVPNNQEPAQIYKDVAWLGLMNFPGQEATIIAFDQLPNSEKNRIITVLNTLLQNNANETCTE